MTRSNSDPQHAEMRAARDALVSQVGKIVARPLDDETALADLEAVLAGDHSPAVCHAIRTRPELGRPVLVAVTETEDQASEDPGEPSSQQPAPTPVVPGGDAA